MGPWMHAGEGWGWMLGWHLLSWVLVAAIVVLVAVILGKAVGGREDRSDPERILAERYARGEIGTDEYRSRREALR